VTGAIGVFERLSGRVLSKKVYFRIFVVAFSLAGLFMAWREQYERAEALEASLQSKPSPPVQVNIPPITLPPAQVIVQSNPAWKTRNTAELRSADFQIISVIPRQAHDLKLTLKNFGEIPAFGISLARSLEKRGLPPLNESERYSIPAKLTYPQVPSGGSFDIYLSSDYKTIKQPLHLDRDNGLFILRMRGLLTYSDRQSTTPHTLALCYEDVGYILKQATGLELIPENIRNSGAFVECSKP